MTTTMVESRLFKPLRIGNIEVKHRIAMPSLTRMRASNDRVPTPMMKEYYSQRASVPGTLILAEGCVISPDSAGGFPSGPGIWNAEQVKAWRDITDEVHRRGSFIVCQLFAMGRAANVELARQEGIEIVAPSALSFQGGAVPRAMTIDEIKQTVRDFAAAARNAIDAGFDGVECHAAQGYLLDQFLQDISNRRDDEYGGSVENRSRLVVDVLKAMVDAVGPERVGLRLSPWNTFQGMKMQDPIQQFTDIVNKASQLKLAFLDIIESRVAGSDDSDGTEGLDFIYDLWHGPILVAGGFTPEKARELVDTERPDREIVVMFGRHFISNPDLVFRIKKGLALAPYDRATFYVQQSSLGYLDYPFSREYLATATSA